MLLLRKISQGSNENGEVVGIYCHSDVLPHIILPAEKLFVIFVTDEDNEDSGFKFNLTFNGKNMQYVLFTFLVFIMHQLES